MQDTPPISNATGRIWYKSVSSVPYSGQNTVHDQQPLSWLGRIVNSLPLSKNPTFVLGQSGLAVLNARYGKCEVKERRRII